MEKGRSLRVAALITVKARDCYFLVPGWLPCKQQKRVMAPNAAPVIGVASVPRAARE